METTPEHVHHDHVVDETELITNVDRPPLLSWGAVFGGLVFVLSISWLLNLLGAAIGASIADATDGEALNQGLATGTMIWMVVSWLIAFFVGSLLTARLSGKIDDTAGMLHGMVLWGLATAVMIVLSYWGVSGLLRTGYSVAQTTAQTVSGVASAAGSAAYSTVDAVQSIEVDSQLADNIKARLKRRASRLIAKVEAEGGAEVSQAEVRESIEDLDNATLERIGEHIMVGEMTQAREVLAEETELTEAEVNEILEGVENEFEEQLGTDDNQTGLAGDITNSLNAQVADFVASLDEAGGAAVTKEDVRLAIRQMDRETMNTVANRLIQGDPQGAKDALAANTNLSSRQINDVVDGVYGDVSRTVDRYQHQVSETIESATTYAQAVLWTIFVASAMGLAVSLLGGWLGTESSRRLQAEVHHRIR